MYEKMMATKFWRKATTLSVRTPFFPINTTSVFFRRDLHSPTVRRQMPPSSASRALLYCALRPGLEAAASQ